MNTTELLDVYHQSIENTMERYSVSRFHAESEFVSYLSDCFFKEKTSFCALLIKDGHYVCGLRMERFHDGWLLSALETAPDQRRKGYAFELVRMILEHYHPVYSHVDKDNKASLAVHRKCGFMQLYDYGRLLDGTVSNRYCTLIAK